MASFATPSALGLALVKAAGLIKVFDLPRRIARPKKARRVPVREQGWGVNEKNGVKTASHSIYFLDSSDVVVTTGNQ